MLRCTTQFQTSQSLQQIRLLRVARVQTSDWIQLRGSQAIQGSYVARCEKSLQWAGTTHNMYKFCCKK